MKLVMTLPDRVYALGALRAAVSAAAALIVVYARASSARGAGRACLKQARLCASLTRSLIARSVHNQRLERKQDMQASPARRAQVLRDLGGEVALTRWEARLERARKREIFRAAQARYQAQNSGQPSVENEAAWRGAAAGPEARKSALLTRENWAHKHKLQQIRKNRDGRYPNLFYDPCRLDRSGVFRLAAIARGPRLTLASDHVAGQRRTGVLRREARRRPIRDGKVRYLSGLAAPIPLLPKDLRVRIGKDKPDWGPPLRAASGGGGVRHRPPKGRPP